MSPDPDTLRLRTCVSTEPGDVPGLLAWTSVLHATAHGTTRELGRARGLLVDLAVPGAGDLLRALREVDEDAHALGITLLGLRAHALGLKGARTGVAVQHVEMLPEHRGLGLGAVLVTQTCDLLGFGRTSMPVVLVPYPDGGEDMAPTVLAEARDKVERAAAAAGFSPATAAAGGLDDLPLSAGAPWWRTTSRTAEPAAEPPDDVVDRLLLSLRPGARVQVRRALPWDPEAAAVLRTYITEVASRWYGRPATEAEVDDALRAGPSGELVAPSGCFWLAELDGCVVGCVGVEHVGPRLGEVKRVFVHPDVRGRRIGSALLDVVELHARAQGITTLRLDTREDLVESHRLYERHGYVRTAAFNADQYAQRWYAKPLLPDAVG